MPHTTRLLLKLRSSSALRAAGPRANLRPLYNPTPTAASFGLDGSADWYVADMPEPAASQWDLAHAQVAAKLGIAESDVLFAEPDIAHTIYRDTNERPSGPGFAVGEKCVAIPPDGSSGKALGPNLFAWHLEDGFSGLRTAREAVEFSDPRTRIAHIDTGYYRAHVAVPERIVQSLERNFVPGDKNAGSSEDPDNRVLLLDNSGHGTGTIGILAGGKIKAQGDVYLGGAPFAEVLPLRIADSVALFHTSALAEAFRYALAQRCDVVTLSMGGLPSRAWSEAVNEAYLGGVCICAAAGNNVNGLPTHHVVYPARYHRVLAVCGVMANGKPYTGLTGLTTLEGNFGPDSSMSEAIATYTPNIPWPVYGCPDVIRLNGEGTSAATPQIAAAAALWFEKYKRELPRDWRRVEAVRHALFESAKDKGQNAQQVGHGVLQAHKALAIHPVLGLPQSKADSDSFAFLRVITGLGITAPVPREEMFNLEITQLWMVNAELQKIVPDPDRMQTLDEKSLKKFMEALIEDDRASLALRRHVAARYPSITGSSAPRSVKSADVLPENARACEQEVTIGPPPFRRVRVYAMDPSFSTELATASINEVTLNVRWEKLDPGPTGEYIEVVDIDASGAEYKKVDLNDPSLLAQDGWHPSEGNPAFHQQMVYAVAMKTIQHFEQALGRPVLWRHTANAEKPEDDSCFTPRLKIKPHALRVANAFYSPEEIALLFGYFDAGADDPGNHVPGSRVYACLSHDIIAHETTHAILDGMHRRFSIATNPDVLAFHEGFADIVALMQHFTINQLLENEIGKTRGDLETESTLGSLAVQFGRAIGGRGALRDAIGTVDANGKWLRQQPNPGDYQKLLTPHGRGGLLVAAVFDAFLAIYRTRTSDLLRIYTGGTGVLPEGALHPDLVRRLSDEAAKSAGHVLNICIRALDYVPPVDITFGDFLRALITADFDLIADDHFNYRVAFVEAFRRRGIYPLDLATLSVDTLRWQGFDVGEFKLHYEAIKDVLKRYADDCLYLTDRHKLFDRTRDARIELHGLLENAFRATPELARSLGLDASLGKFEVHELRRAVRVTPEGRYVPQVIGSLTQTVEIPESNETPAHLFRGGTTLVVDLSPLSVRYRVGKGIHNAARRERTAAFRREIASDPLRALMFADQRREPFAVLHALSG